ncbi:MAG: VOC family protein [Haliscomenobacter sp.]|nr:VOC family protein [Haliscomenobacter sp.]
MNHPMCPCLWFDQNAQEAAAFYCSVFPNSRLLQESPMAVTFLVNGTKLMALNGGLTYQINPAISFSTTAAAKRRFCAFIPILSEQGQVLMPLDKYDWSPKYAWVVDRFGVSWQLDMDPINSPQKVVPSLLFANAKSGEVKNALTHYSRIFPDSRILMEAPYPPSAQQPEGALLFAQFKLSGFIFNSMSSSIPHDFDFCPAVSFVIEADTQETIDYFWEQLGAGGQFGRCGWLADRFGVSWQVIPAMLSALMNDPEKAPRVVQAFLAMDKLDLETLQNA